MMPHMRDYSPSVVNGLFFERLSFGLVPMSIMGVRIVPQTYSGQNVAIGEAFRVYGLGFRAVRMWQLVRPDRPKRFHIDGKG